MELRGLLNYLLPYYYGAQTGPAVIGYISTAGLILVAIGLKLIKIKAVSFFFISAFVFTLLSLGNITFLHQFAYLFIPFYGYFRFLTFIHIYTAFSLAVLAGYGYTYLLEHEFPKSVATWLKALTLLFILIYFISIFVGLILKAIGGNPVDINNITDGLSLFFVFFIPTYILFRFKKYINPSIFKFSLVVLILLDLFTLISKSAFINSTQDPRVFYSENTITKKYSTEMRNNLTRAYFFEETNRFNTASSEIYQTEGFHGLTLKDYNLLYNHFQEADWSVSPDSQLFDILAVQYIFTSKPFAEKLPNGLDLIEAVPIREEDSGKFILRTGTVLPVGTPIYVYENTDRLPMAFITENILKVKTSKEALEKMSSLDLRRTAVVISDSNLPLFDNQKPGSYANIYHYSNSKVKIDVKSIDDSLLVLSNTYYPGWQAYIDGKPTKIYKTNLTSRGILLTNGKHDVEFIYVPKLLYLGMIISIISFIVSLILIKKLK